jgi:RNA polymerase-interacting CarD/CdnL/TRCF family regulator
VNPLPHNKSNKWGTPHHKEQEYTTRCVNYGNKSHETHSNDWPAFLKKKTYKIAYVEGITVRELFKRIAHAQLNNAPPPIHTEMMKELLQTLQQELRRHRESMISKINKGIKELTEDLNVFYFS